MNPQKIGREETDRPLPANQASGLERYVDRKPLAEGGGALLETAIDTVLGREVVIKMLHPKFMENEVMRLRFLREARVVSMIAHPSTPSIYDLGIDSDGTPFFTMQRIDGDDLRTILSKMEAAPSEPSEFSSLDARLELVIDVGQALAFSHSVGVLHRDVKPANILVGAFGQVKLMDWGIAKILQEGSGMDRLAKLQDEHPEDLPPELTEMGTMFGTPQYMSPEQARGELDLDGRTDVFSLGVVMFEALTLCPLFVGPDRSSVLAAVSNQPVPDLSETAGVEIPFELDAILRKALKRPRHKRYASMSEFVRDLQHFRHDEPVSVVDYTNFQRVRFWGRKIAGQRKQEP